MQNLQNPLVRRFLLCAKQVGKITTSKYDSIGVIKIIIIIISKIFALIHSTVKWNSERWRFTSVNGFVVFR